MEPNGLTDLQQEVQTFLLTLASRIGDTKGCIVFVVEKDDTVMQHISHFTSETPWLTVVGNLESVKVQVLTQKVGFSPVNMDGSPVEDDENLGETE